MTALSTYSKKPPSYESLDSFCLDKFIQWVKEYSDFGEVRLDIDFSKLKDALDGKTQQDCLRYLQDVYARSLS